MKVWYGVFEEEVTAFFIDNTKDTLIDSYAHIGQHGESDIGFFLECRDAKEEEKAALHKELLRIYPELEEVSTTYVHQCLEMLKDAKGYSDFAGRHYPIARDVRLNHISTKLKDVWAWAINEGDFEMPETCPELSAEQWDETDMHYACIANIQTMLSGDTLRELPEILIDKYNLPEDYQAEIVFNLMGRADGHCVLTVFSGCKMYGWEYQEQSFTWYKGLLAYTEHWASFDPHDIFMREAAYQLEQILLDSEA